MFRYLSLTHAYRTQKILTTHVSIYSYPKSSSNNYPGVPEKFIYNFFKDLTYANLVSRYSSNSEYILLPLSETSIILLI